MIHKSHFDEPNKEKSPVMLKMYLMLGFVTSVMFFSMVFIFFMGRRMTAIYTPLIDATMEIKLEATRGHLWFEEIISGDNSESMEFVIELIDNSDWYAKAMLEGGENLEGEFFPIKDARLRDDIKLVREKIAELKAIANKRLEMKDAGGIGSELDQEYDAVFKEFMKKTDDVETKLQVLITDDLKSFQAIQVSLICLCLVVFVVLGYILRRLLLIQLRDKTNLRSANQQLDASNQQLRANEQQLRASNQQLRAIEQQLRASNQQLDAANQQLQANEQQLRASNQQLDAANQELVVKNEELQSIVYISSHDLRSPLVNINGFSGVLAERCEQISRFFESLEIDEDLKKEIMPVLSEEIPEALGFISSSTDMMHKLIDGLLRVSRIGTSELNIKKIDMNAVVSRIADTFKFKADSAGAEVILGDLPDCTGDEDQVAQVFANLIDNSLKYLDSERKGIVRVSGEMKGNKSVYFVEDNGIGIAADHKNKVFGIYQRLDPNGPVEGEGLGLTIVKRVVDRHKGKIQFESKEGVGTKFMVSLQK